MEMQRQDAQSPFNLALTRNAQTDKADVFAQHLMTTLAALGTVPCCLWLGRCCVECPVSHHVPCLSLSSLDSIALGCSLFFMCSSAHAYSTNILPLTRRHGPAIVGQRYCCEPPPAPPVRLGFLCLQLPSCQ